jgi:hypothetical protein
MKIGAQLWEIADQLRGSGEMDLVEVLRVAKERGLGVSIADLRELPTMRRSDLLIVPENLIETIAGICKGVKPNSVLDPLASVGQLILPVANSLALADCTAIVVKPQDAEVAQLFEQANPVQWMVGDPLDTLDGLGTFDAIVCCPPFNWNAWNREFQLGTTTIRDYFGNLVIAKACAKHLSSGGVALVVVPPSFLFKTAPRSLRTSLEPLGLHLSALIHIPNGWFTHTSIDSYLAVIDKAQHSDLFVAQLGEDKNHNQIIVENFLKRQSGSDLATGALVEPKIMGYREREAKARVEKLAQRMGVSPTPMADVALEINLTKSSDPNDFPERDNVVYVPLIGKSLARTSTGELSMKAHNYAQLVLDPEKALAPYVAGYLNSELGRVTLAGLESGTFIPKRTKGALSTCVVHLLSMDDQIACVEADSRALNVLSEVNSIRTSIWDRPRALKKTLQKLKNVNREDTLATWIENLPFPLASILWAYYTCRDNDKTKYEHLLQFFEGLAEFYGIVMWSATVNAPTLAGDPRYPISADKPFINSFSRSTFGAWVEMVERLSKFGRILLNGKVDDKEAIFAAFATRDSDVLGNMFSSELISLMQSTNHIRNVASHGGKVGDREAKRRRVELEQALAEARNHIGDIWLQYEMFKADATRYKDGVYHYEVERVMGSHPPFVRTTVTLSDAVEDGELFLRASESTEALQLQPLVVLGPSPEEAQNACYFYNRIEGNEMEFKSFHFGEQAEIRRSDAESTRAVRLLIDQTGSTPG